MLTGHPLASSELNFSCVVGGGALSLLSDLFCLQAKPIGN